jgi:transposase
VFDAELYKQRNVVERCFNRLKQFRDLATRYAKRAAYYQAELTIAAIVLWLR